MTLSRQHWMTSLPTSNRDGINRRYAREIKSGYVNQSFRRINSSPEAFFLTYIIVSVIIIAVKQRRSLPLLTLRTCPSGSIMIRIIMTLFFWRIGGSSFGPLFICRTGCKAGALKDREADCELLGTILTLGGV